MLCVVVHLCKLVLHCVIVRLLWQAPDSVILAAVDANTRVSFNNAVSTDWLPGKKVGSCLYRGSVHGMTGAAFHERCDGKGATLTLVRADEGGRVCVFGGYTSASWHSGGEWVKCSDALLFSVTGPHCNVVRFPLRRGEEERAMFCSSGRGPSFGFDLEVRSWSQEATATFDGASHCWLFGHPGHGVYADTVGMGPATFTGTTDEEGHFIPVDMEVYAVV